jgi:hypothetical protein
MIDHNASCGSDFEMDHVENFTPLRQANRDPHVKKAKS